MSHEQKWRRLAPLGLATVGLGLSVLGDTIARKGRGEPWFVRGTVALSLVNAGLAVFGDAIKERALYELASPHPASKEHHETDHHL